MDAAGRCVRTASTLKAVLSLALISVLATGTLHYIVLPSLRRRVVPSVEHVVHPRDHDLGLVVDLDVGVDPVEASDPHSTPRSVQRHAQKTLPPGKWAWSDVKTQRGHPVIFTPTEVQHSDTKSTDTSLSSFTEELQTHTSPDNGDCEGCEANTSGPCKHHFLPICFALNTSTETCPSATVACADGRSLPPNTVEVVRLPQKLATKVSTEHQFVFVTAATTNHFCPLLNLLRSLHARAPDVPVIVYDLHGEGEVWLNRTAMYSAHPNIFRTVKFKYAGLPSWFNVNDRAGEYAWKPLIIKEVVDEFSSAMWVDSGNLAMGRLDVQILKDLIGATGFYSPKSPQTPWHWVHPGTFAHFGMRKCCADPAISKRRPCCCCATTATKCDPCNEQSSLDHTNASFWLQKTMCNGALVGFQRDTPGYTSVLVPWVACALNRSCIAPLGPGGPSHRGNHRQDQAALTMLSHLHGMPCVDKELGAGFKLHQDNRWTNQSYCDTILNGVAHNAAVDMQSVTISRAADSTRTPAIIDHRPRDFGWAPKKQREDILSAGCLAATSASRTSSGTTITHIINPFPTTDVHFHWTYDGLAAAYEQAQQAGLTVEVLAVTFDHESLVEVPDFITVLPIIWANRSAGEYLERIGVEFDTEEVPLRGPIVSDVWQAAHDHATGNTLIWTNFDLIVGPEFYIEIVKNLDNPSERLKMPGLVGYSSLRFDMIIPRARFPSLSNWTVADFFAWNNTRNQAGHDTFAFPRHWIPCLEMADMAFGVGGWDHAIYSQMKWLAALEHKQFRTLSPGRGLPANGLIRHIGSQIANSKKVWTNPVSWKGPARIAQYNFNKRCKAAVEIFLKFAFAGPQFCRKRIFGQCSVDVPTLDTKSDLLHAPKNDYRLVGLATADPSSSVANTVQWMTGYRVESAHQLDLTAERRNEAMAVVTHAADLFAGPKPYDVLVPQAVPEPGKKGRILRLRAVSVVLDDPVVAVVAMARRVALATSTTFDATTLTKAELAPFVNHYNTFWSFWTSKAVASGVAVEIFNLALSNASALTLELSILQQFLVYHRCGPSQQNECHSTTNGVGICCAILKLPSPPSIGRISTDVRTWIQTSTAKTVGSALRQWEIGRRRFPWPLVAWNKCCE